MDIITLNHGLQLRIVTHADGDTVFLASGEETVLRIDIAADEPRVELRARHLALRADERIDIAAPQVAIHAEDDLQLASGGAAGLEVAGPLRVEGHTTELRSRRGDVAIHANDDVRIDGERIKLNY
ncbi:MAG: hypothetical protein ACOCYN_04580 [Planctomycetota bacterium]